jgi:Zn-finger nucleic acid-binding protein
MKCPRCGSTDFVTTQYEDVEIDRCQSCHGIWLDEGELVEIVDVRDKKFNKELVKKTVSNAFMGVPKTEHDEELICPKCGTAMNPVNYAISSGVIIDRCPNDCGVWFDNHELEKVQAYREYWQDETKNKEEVFNKLLADADKNDGFEDGVDHWGVLYPVAKFFSKFIK